MTPPLPVLIALSTATLSCSACAGNNHTNTSHSGMFTFLALGDSYTIGEAVAPEERWPNVLAGMLRARGVPLSDPVIIATTGWTTDELNAAIDQQNPAGSFDLVTLLIGVNNQYRGRDTADYRTEFRGLLERAVRFANGHAGHVVVLSIPDWGVMPFAEGRDRARIAKEIDAFNLINRQEALLRGTRYADVTAASRLAATQPALVASDGLHPSGAQYKLWADLVLPVAREALGVQ